MSRPLPNLIARLRRVARPREAGDGDALTNFARTHDPDAFAHLVRRFGPMVQAVCRRQLGDTPDADDAYQATFLVLIRKARTVRPPDAIGSWLFAVAHRTAVYSRTVMHRRAAKLRPLDTEPATAPPVSSDLMTALDAELANLPDKFRDAVVLCELDGKSLKEAAEAMGVPVGTLASRLARGRQLLADRLKAKGFVVTAAAVSGVLASAGTSVAAPEFNPSAVTSAAQIAHGVMKMGLLSKLKLTTALTAVLIATGLFGMGLVPSPTPPPLPVAHAAPVPKDEGKLTPEKKLELDRLFNNLGSYSSHSIRAALTFVGQPDVTVRYLNEKLRPVKIDEKQAKALLAKMFAEDEKEWRTTLYELQHFDPRLVMSIPEIWAEAKTDEQRARVVALICHDDPDLPSYTFQLRDTTRDNGMFAVDATTKPGVKLPRWRGRENVTVVMTAAPSVKELLKWPAEENAITVLEHIGTPEAVKVIEKMAGGHPEASPTVVAKETLARLKKK